MDSSSIPLDSDGDGTCDALDVDDDGDGVINSEDEFPLDPYEWEDTDGDGLGNNADTMMMVTDMTTLLIGLH